MNSYSATEDRITEALASINSNSKPNLKKLAEKFAIPYYRLYARANGRLSRSNRPSVNLRLNPTEELALCRYLNIMEEAGLYARYYHIKRTANSILSRRPEPELPISSAWATRFLKRHPEYHIRRQRTLDIKRKEAHNQRDIKVFFKRWKAVLDKYAIKPADIYNFDETGFRIGIGRHQKIITRDLKAKSYIKSSTNRDYVTVIETISADSSTIPPMIILNAASY